MLTALITSIMLFSTDPLPDTYILLPTNPSRIAQEIELGIEEEEELNEDDVELLSLLVLAEAEGECDLGKMLVADVVLNRVDSELFPNTIKEVVYEKNQFSSMHNGRWKKVIVDEETRELVRDEMRDRFCDKAMYFKQNGYFKSSKLTDLYHVGGHYFSAQKEE